MKPFAQMNARELQQSLSDLQGRLSTIEPRSRLADRLMLDLEVHQVKLEMQNRELRKALAELEASRNVYAELYDFAPVACMTLDRAGVIHDMNLAAATLLGRRERSLHWTFLTFVAAVDRWRLQDHLQRSLDPTPSSIDITLNVRGVTLPARLITAPRTDDQSLLRAALIDLAPPSSPNKAHPFLDQDRHFERSRATAQADSASGDPARLGSSNLSGREQMVIRFIAQGYSNKEIAGRLSLSVKTIETHKARSLKKLGLRTRAELVRHALQRGWLEGPGFTEQQPASEL